MLTTWPEEFTVAELCDWYLVEARAERILGRRERPIKESTLTNDETRISVHIKPLIGARIASSLTIADVEGMQTEIEWGKTAKPRSKGRGGVSTGGVGAAARSVATLQSILGHAKRRGLLDENPAKGAKRIPAGRKRRRLSEVEIEQLGAALAFAEQIGENRTALSIVRRLLLSGLRRQEGQAMRRRWFNASDGYVAFPDARGDARIRVLGPAAIRVIEEQPVAGSNPYVFPSATTAGPFTVVRATLYRLCVFAKIESVTPHTLRYTFASVATDLGCSATTVTTMLGQGPRTVIYGHVGVDEALKFAVANTSNHIAEALRRGEQRVARKCSEAG